MKKYKILMFDLDDTLIDNYENVKFAFKKMIETKDIVYSDDDFKRWYNIDCQFWKDWQDGLIEVPEPFNKEVGFKSDAFLDWIRAQRVLIYFDNKITLEEAINLNNIYMNALTENVIEISGASEVLKTLTKNYYVIVVTNGPKVATRDKLTKIGAIEYVNKILSADMFGYMKPDKKFYESIQKVLNNYNNDEYLIIGDSLKSDVGFGMNSNIDSCWFNKDNKDLVLEYKPTYVINNLKELINLLK